jgi:hypothetical protein
MESSSQITEYSDRSDGILGESAILGGTADWDYPRKTSQTNIDRDWRNEEKCGVSMTTVSLLYIRKIRHTDVVQKEFNV